MGRLDNLDQRITPEVICEFNERVLAGLEVEPGVVPGQYRVHGVAVGDVYRGAPADDVPHLVGEMCEWLNRPDFLSDDPERRIIFAIVRAVLAHLYIAWIHPFGDGNGRTARLVEFLSLVVAGAPSAAAHLLSNHYNETRSEYYRQLAAASRNGGDVTPFLAYAIQGLVDQLRTQIERVYLQILNDAWQNHVHESVPGTSEVAQRQRNLVLDLTAVGQPLSIDDLAGVSPRVASAYGRRSPKTLVRDVNTLVAKGLLLKDAAGVAANTSVVLGLLPPRVVQP
jgi:Fic family protein